MVNEERNAVREKRYAFALRVIGLARGLRKEKEFELAAQIVRSGTSIGANVEEAQAAQSRADFVAKMSIAAKEARETHCWLRLLRDSKTGPFDDVAGMLQDASELIRLLTAIVKTGQRPASSCIKHSTFTIQHSRAACARSPSAALQRPQERAYR